jgi:hypothetical protein
MEPVFMILGQSAATAACMAIDDKVPVQSVNYSRLQARLTADKQDLETAANSFKTKAIAMDNADADGVASVDIQTNRTTHMDHVVTGR